MPALVLYLMKLSISLSAVWIFYQLLLRRLTFYGLNRWYLLFYSLLSFFIPLIDVGRIMDQEVAGMPVVIRIIPSITPYEAPVALPVAVSSPFWDVWTILLSLALLGSGILLMRAVISWISLRRLRKRAICYLADLPAPIRDQGVSIYQVEAPISPFSFGKTIYINSGSHTAKELEEIILHEYVHIQQKHTVDILLAELFVILNWYNPFAWLIRHSIRQNLEFIADSKVLEKGLDRKSYQYHLVKVVGQSSYRLANKFNFTSLKKRIIMMNKSRSARLHLVKFLFILPLIALLLVAFRNKYSTLLHGRKELAVNVTGIITDDHYFKPLEGATVVDKTSGLSAVTDARGFYRLHIPATNGAVHLQLEFEKSGYARNKYGYSFVMQEPRGLICIEMLHLSSDKQVYISVPAFTDGKYPADPGYKDALAVLQAKIDKQKDLQPFISMPTEHPEVAPVPDTGRIDPHSIGVGVYNGEFYAGVKGAAAKSSARLLYLIDGAPGAFDKQKLTMQTVYAVDVLTGEKARALYGKRGSNGVIAITTRSSTRRDIESWGPTRSPGILISGKDTILTYWH